MGHERARRSTDIDRLLAYLPAADVLKKQTPNTVERPRGTLIDLATRF
jgi:hypothetical protein